MKDTKVAPGFRGDVNGLRAWAVVAVILFHFGVPGFGGGFAGVDVFFVISGFLMTGIVLNGLERAQGHRGLFLIDFYLARARRILPALVVVCAVLLVLGWWVLLPFDYKALGTYTVASLLFLSNVKFWRDAGYFDSSSHEKWLLHTWSLAVEWQFYLLLPLILLVVWKLHASRRTITLVMLAGCLTSLVGSMVATQTAPTAAFYLLHTRAWEMLAGGLVFLIPYKRVLNERQRWLLEAAGLGLFLAAAMGFDSSSAWPGWHAGVPVMGAVLVLVSARHNTLWTGHAAAQWLGTRSYSLYLWHWPLVVALAYLDLKNQPLATIAALLLTLLLGHLSYRWVEVWSRQQLSRLHPIWCATALTCGLLLVLVPAAWILSEDGVAGRFSTAIESVNGEASNGNPRQEECHPATGLASPSCIYGGNQLGVIVIGDSHANAVVSAVATARTNPKEGVMEWSYTACPTLFGVQPTPKRKFPAGFKCSGFLDMALEKLAAVPKDVSVVIVNRTTHYAIGFNEPWEDDANTATPLVFFTRFYTSATPDFLAEFSEKITDSACRLAKNHSVFLVRPIPEMRINVPNTLARSLVWGTHKELSISLAEYHERHAFVWAAQNAAYERCGVKILDPLPYLCWEGRCHGVKDGRSLYTDDDHLSEFGNKLLVPMFAKVFQKV